MAELRLRALKKMHMPRFKQIHKRLHGRRLTEGAAFGKSLSARIWITLMHICTQL